MRRWLGHLAAVLVVSFATSSILLGSPQGQDSSGSASEPKKKRSLLSVIFDGVPAPGTEKTPRRVAKKPSEAAAGEVAEADAAPAVEKPRPEIEQLKSWLDIQKALPADIMGGPDWVQAVKMGVIAPRYRLPSDPIPHRPLTLDTFLASAASDAVAPFDLDIDIVPDEAPLYKAVFPHSSHSLWLNCSSCHRGIVSERGSGMRQIFSGEYCGRCHGKVSFSPLTSCPRCHVNLVPAPAEVIDADLVKAAQTALGASAEALERGKAVYLDACAVCHGEEGNGRGPLAAGLDPLPRDFTAGKFQFRTTNSSSLPTDYDMFRTITRGIPGTSMPSFSFLSYDDRSALTQYVKTFSPLFATLKPPVPITIPDAPAKTPELMEMGKKFFKEADCHKCHGETGRGDGPSAPTLKDDWDRPVRAFDLTSGRPKSGSTLKDYYRILMTGLKGTPMPDFSEVFEPEQAWAVVYFAYSLGEDRTIAPAVKGEIRFTRAAAVASTPPKDGGSDPLQENQPPAVFAHWFHRIRVRCAVCHPNVFQMKAGANNITMEAIRDGKFCGRCHPSYPDPKALVAWSLTFDVCARCHSGG
jgi:c(7)-type cytochrome triheme protein